MSRLREVKQEEVLEEQVKPDQPAFSIMRSYDYNQFGYIDGNRNINQTNYAKLEKSMLEEQLIIPICVNKEKKIIDGQHRFEVEKNNNLPVYYYIIDNYEIEQVKRANMVSRNWTKKDFLNLQIENSKDSYLVFGYLVDTYSINIQDLLKVFAIVQETNLALIGKAFEEGKLTDDGCEKVEAFLKALNDFSGFRYYRTSQFVTAFLKLYFYPDYDHKKMKERIKKREVAFQKKTSIDEYIGMLTRDVYSFGAIRNPIYYDSTTKKFYK